MRRVLAALTILLLAAAAAPSSAAPLRPGELASREAVLAWMNGYRVKRDLAHVPDAVQAMSQLGIFKDPENAGAFVGFIAGVIASNPAQAEGLIVKMLPLPPEDQWAVVQAIAYSELPGWKSLLRSFNDRLPARRLMIERYLNGQLPTLGQAGFTKEPGAFAKLGGYLGLGDDKPKTVALMPSPALLDVLWGYYCATGGYNPAISRIVELTSWAKDRDMSTGSRSAAWRSTRSPPMRRRTRSCWRC